MQQLDGLVGRVAALVARAADGLDDGAVHVVLGNVAEVVGRHVVVAAKVLFAQQLQQLVQRVVAGVRRDEAAQRVGRLRAHAVVDVAVVDAEEQLVDRLERLEARQRARRLDLRADVLVVVELLAAHELGLAAPRALLGPPRPREPHHPLHRRVDAQPQQRDVGAHQHLGAVVAVVAARLAAAARPLAPAALALAPRVDVELDQLQLLGDRRVVHLRVRAVALAVRLAPRHAHLAADQRRRRRGGRRGRAAVGGGGGGRGCGCGGVGVVVVRLLKHELDLELAAVVRKVGAERRRPSRLVDPLPEEDRQVGGRVLPARPGRREERREERREQR